MNVTHCSLLSTTITMFSTPVNLFNKWDPTTQGQHPNMQEIVLYCASRLRAIVRTATAAADPAWMMDGLCTELVSNFLPHHVISRDMLVASNLP
jgi:hypothetical protein